MALLEPRGTQWILILTNYLESEYTSVCKLLSEICSYYVLAKEVSRNDTPQLLGFFVTKRPHKPHTLNSLIAIRGVYLEQAFGDVMENIARCTRGNSIEFGCRPPPSIMMAEAPVNGGKKVAAKTNKRRLIVNDFRELMKKGREGLAAFEHKHPVAWYSYGERLLKQWMMAQMPSERNTKVLWIYGPRGSGKTRMARELLPNAFDKDPRIKWWDSYLLEKDCIIDDLGFEDIDIQNLLKWFSRSKCMVEVKYGSVPLHVCNFVVTSVFTPPLIFSKTTTPLMDVLIRRMKILPLEKCYPPFEMIFSQK